MFEFEVNQQKKSVRILKKNQPLGELIYRMRCDGEYILPSSIFMENRNNIKIYFEFAVIKDNLSIEDDVIRIERTFLVEKLGRWQLLFNYQASPLLKNWVVPSVMYHQNREGEGKYPRGGLSKGWSFREDRIPVPSCSIVHNHRNYQSVFTEPAEQELDISSVKSYLRADEPILEIRTPLTEEPMVYTEKGIFFGGLTQKQENVFHVQKIPFHYSRNYYIAIGDYPNPESFYTRIFDFAVREFKHLVNDNADWGKLAFLKFGHLNHLTIDHNGLNAIKMGDGNGIFQKFFEYTAGSFLVKSIEAAVIYARIGTELKEEKWITTAEKIGRFFLKGTSSNGLHQDMYSLKEKKWGGYFGVGIPKEMNENANARCNGETMTQYIRLYKLLKENGKETGEIEEVVRKNINFYLTHQIQGNLDGCFGRWWALDGSPVNTDGTNGAYIISELCEYEKTAGETEKLDEALFKAAEYYSKLIDQENYYADTLDADCIDKEGGAALCRAFLDLYERSVRKEAPVPEYLNRAVQAAGFVLSWTFTYNTPFPSDTPLGRLNFRTKGMTAVSVAHHHLDFYGPYIAYDFLRLWKYSKDEKWKDYAEILIQASAQLISSEEELLGRSRDFIGWQPEQINQTNWNYHHRKLGTKGKYHTCIAWNAVLTLGAILDIRENFPEILNFDLKYHFGQEKKS